MKTNVYKVTNKINGKFYIGKHNTENPHDSYLGSGRTIIRAVKKYGKAAFVKEILAEFDSESDALDYEASIVTEILILDPMCYNETMGGKGSFHHINSDHSRINPMKDPEIAKRNLAARSLEGMERIRKAARVNIKKTIAHNVGKKRPEHGKKVAITSKKNWTENREKMRDSLSAWYSIIDPEGSVHETNRLGDFCRQRGWTGTALYSSVNSGKAKKKGPAKGWKATILIH